jgi:Mor family transcriptional regulator
LHWQRRSIVPFSTSIPAIFKESMSDITPDLIDRLFDYIKTEIPGMSDNVQRYKSAVRAEFAGEMCYIADKPKTKRQEDAAKVLSLFNGRNSVTIARKLNISRMTVWRYIKQSGGMTLPPPHH